MELFIQISQFVLAISILVILHEFGHFLPARWFGIKVEKFFLFFDVKFALFKKKIGETVYGVGWLPLGGYVKIAGMIDESMDKEQMKKDPEPWEFRSKPAWQRLIVMVGGVTVNVILAWVIYSTMLVVNGDTYIPANNLKYGIDVSEAGEGLGFKNGDQILAIDGKPVKRFDKFLPMDVLLGDEVTVLRGDQEMTFPIKDSGKKLVLNAERGRFITPAFAPKVGDIDEGSIAEALGLEVGSEILSMNNKKVNFWSDVHTAIQDSKGDVLEIKYALNGNFSHKFVHLPMNGTFGVFADTKGYSKTDEYSILSSIPEGWNQTIGVLKNQIKQFKLIFNKEVQGYKNVKGPIGIVEMMEPTWDWTAFWSFTAMFSVWLAFVNILPIPALDGGHVMFLLYEMISGKAPSEKTLERGQIIGFIIVMGLMVVIFGNDIWNLFK
ncbi:RIP metalloprotease RseP [uncultured Dokdonia sp.]|uniref:RIP metalloprotease RseP n=1 Tax=uncultured Dokdonia sp. TaxID=575653 RepID=UPI002622EF3F|nr:RIP metalloprotease RseP [uncultured Dokdonia sp.]